MANELIPFWANFRDGDTANLADGMPTCVMYIAA